MYSMKFNKTRLFVGIAVAFYFCIVFKLLQTKVLYEKKEKKATMAIPSECNCGNNSGVNILAISYFITAVILVRIYKDDKPKWTTKELSQWINYMHYAGVEHVYLYDNYKYPSESLQTWCKNTFSSSLLTYHDWGKFHPYTIGGTQHTAYQHALDYYKNVSKWQIAFDMDEYPFAVHDMNPGFLKRFLLRQIQLHSQISEHSFKNYLFLGKPSNKTLVIERMLRRTPLPANRLDKPLYETRCVKYCGVHHNRLMCGRSKDIDPEIMRMNHYWGARLQKWGDDTPEILSKTIPDQSALELANKLKLWRPSEA